MSMNHDKKPVDEELERMKAEFLAKGGEITKGKTKAMPSELGISNNQWNNKLTKAEKDAKKSPIADDEQ
jgi:DNA-binding NtrC family response regulator